MPKIRDLNPLRNRWGFRFNNSYYEEYFNLLSNAVTVEGVSSSVERFIKTAMIECGSVGYDGLSDQWALVYGEGINEHGNPTYLDFVFLNGKTFRRPAFYDPSEFGAYRILANPSGFAMAEEIERATSFMADCDVAIAQNVDATKTPFFVQCKSPEMRLSVQQAMEQRRRGEPVIIVSEEFGEGVKTVPLTVPYVADKILEIRDAERDKLLNKLGIMSANINKRERVQVGEVNATVGQCEDYIYTWIDTFNKQCESFGLPFKMKLNGSLELLYDNSTDEGGEADDKSEFDSVGV